MLQIPMQPKSIKQYDLRAKPVFVKIIDNIAKNVGFDLSSQLKLSKPNILKS